MSAPQRKKRVPALKHTDARGIGWHVSFRDPKTNQPRKHRFGNVDKATAEAMYYDWVAAHLRGETLSTEAQHTNRKLAKQTDTAKSGSVSADIVKGSLLHIASGFLLYEQGRIRRDDSDRRQNTISPKQYNSRKQFTEELLTFLNDRHGKGAVGRMKLSDFSMEDVEAFNQHLVKSDFSDSQVRKRMQLVKAIIDRAGRTEYGKQVLAWNWNSRDHYHGRPDKPIALPTLKQLNLILRECDEQRTAMVWLAIGCGFGQRDLSAIRVGDIDNQSYDLRRPKTGIDRYGETPKLVWASVAGYLAKVPRPHGELMFLTQRRRQLVHNDSDSVEQWWTRLRTSLGEDGKGINGFYSAPLQAQLSTVSRPGCSIGDMRRWLGPLGEFAVADR